MIYRLLLHYLLLLFFQIHDLSQFGEVLEKLYAFLLLI